MTLTYGVFTMKKIILGVVAVALSAGFVAGCAQQPKPEPMKPIVRKG